MPSPDYSISTPENVDLHLELAGLGNRILACLIDKLIIFSVLLVLVGTLWLIDIGAGMGGFGATTKNLVTALLLMFGILAAFALVFGYNIFFEGTWQGQTPGKKIVQIRVIDQSGQPVSWSAVFIRNVIRVLDENLVLIGLLSMIVDKNERRFGDLAAGTLVIRERLPELSTAKIVLQYPADQSDTLDVGRVTPQEYDLLVSFLKRRTRMAQSQRPIVAKQLEDHFRDKLEEPSKGQPSEPFLEKVYSAYQSRAQS
jgi:uncharacterized RDD family membrane protein YckC